jgi:hypothetical protein
MNRPMSHALAIRSTWMFARVTHVRPRTSSGRGIGSGFGAAFAGLLMTDGSMALPLVIGAGMKVAYDLLLWLAFRRIRPPEEQRGTA